MSEEDETVVPWKSFLTSKFILEVVGSGGAGDEVDAGAVDIEAEPDIDGVGVELADEEAPKGTAEDLDDIDALPLT